MTRYRNVYLPGHPLASVGGLLGEHRAVLFDKIGYGPHLCHWCGDPVHWRRTLFADHVDEDKLNNDPENLVPACRSCNQWRERKKEGEKTYICSHCGVTFSRYKSQRSGARTYCTQVCYLADRYQKPTSSYTKSLRKA